jgi:hypothetical protein
MGVLRLAGPRIILWWGVYVRIILLLPTYADIRRCGGGGKKGLW